MKNLRRLALVSSIAALSAVAFNPTAQAESATQDINFAGTVPAVCTFSNTTAGSLVSANNRLKGAGGLGNVVGGTYGTTSVVCNGGAALSVAAPVQVTAPAGFSAVNTQTIVYDPTYGQNLQTVPASGNAMINGLNSDPLSLAANESHSYQVGMVVVPTNDTILPGSYSYKVTLTATPN
ncbi:hypothetical protein PN450_02130 [Dolichospermum lemmermannii CS-548]|uniref:hypothetical protein n=1 Tax=Dolichospermum lemmermannii TaxID=54295 RepID=UPI00232F3560|nr:hypothetical protein [Dolichospermum lemmermannii]MDB9435627.1 hypothetical protein [Dolichospermum lemmermannii CS-548]